MQYKNGDISGAQNMTGVKKFEMTRYFILLERKHLLTPSSTFFLEKCLVPQLVTRVIQ